MHSNATVEDVMTILVRFTINPDTIYLASLSDDVGEYQAFNAIIGVLQAGWILASRAIKSGSECRMCQPVYYSLTQALYSQASNVHTATQRPGVLCRTWHPY